MTVEFSQGELIRIGRHETSTLCRSARERKPVFKECPIDQTNIYSHPKVKNIFESLEGKVGLIVYVLRNRLEQAVGYRVLLEGTEMFCKSIVAHKYFQSMETTNDESGGSSKV